MNVCLQDINKMRVQEDHEYANEGAEGFLVRC